MNNRLKNVSLALLISATSLQVFADNGYYKDFETSIVKNLVTDYDVDNSDQKDDTQKLQSAINELSQMGGAEIIIPAGVYYFMNVELKSNIKLLIDESASIRPYLQAMYDNGGDAIFNVGRHNDEVVKNVAVTSLQKDKRFIVQLPAITKVSGANPAKPFNNVYGIKVFHFFNIENFLTSNMNIYDNNTKYSAMSLNVILTDKNKANRGKLPTSGDVKNITIYNAAYGYGAVQAQAANKVYFENIESEGGAALRLETGYAPMNNMQLGGVTNIKAKDIRCINGSAALTLSPHTIQTNENIEAHNISADGCNFSVRIATGFISKKNTTEGLKLGVFKNVSIDGIDATFGYHSQILHKDFSLLSKDLQRYIFRTDNALEALAGPSIAAVGYVGGPGQPRNYEASLTNIKMHGFKAGAKQVIIPADKGKVYTTEE